MNSRKFAILMGLSISILVILACTINLGGPDYPTPAIPISTEAIGQLRQGIETAVVAGAVSGQITLVITEPELSSYLDYKLSAQPEPVITYPQAYLRNGQIQIYGMAHRGSFVATARIVLTAGVDAQGQPVIELTSADFGPLPVPEGLKEAITTMIREAYTGALGPAATGFRLESITIVDGSMTVVGRIK